MLGMIEEEQRPVQLRRQRLRGQVFVLSVIVFLREIFAIRCVWLPKRQKARNLPPGGWLCPSPFSSLLNPVCVPGMSFKPQGLALKPQLTTPTAGPSNCNLKFYLYTCEVICCSCISQYFQLLRYMFQVPKMNFHMYNANYYLKS